MRKFLVILYALGFMIGLTGYASAILFNETGSLGVTLVEEPTAGFIFPNGYCCANNTADDFGILLDSVNSATLAFSEYRIYDNDNKAEEEGVQTGSLEEGGIRVNRRVRSWDLPSIPIVDINSIFVSTANAGDSSNLTIGDFGSWNDVKLEFSSSNFTPDNTDAAPPFAESAAMLVFGFGLIGLSSFGRKKLSKIDSSSKHLSPAYGR